VLTDNNLDQPAVFNSLVPVGGQIVVTLTKLNTYNYLNGFILKENGSGSSTPSNTPPTANAGTDKNLTLPANSVQLAGSGTDAIGSIVSYNWSKIAGPSSFSFSSATSANTTVTGLVSGSYTFRLTVTDNQGAIDTDDVNVVVSTGTTNPPPSESKQVKVNIYGGSNAYSNSEWNNWNTNASRTSSNFTYSDGTSSSIKAVLSAQNAVSDNSSTYAVTMAPREVGRYASYSTSNRTLTISGLDNGKTYNIELYGSRKGVSNNTTRYTAGGSSVDVLTDNNLDQKAVFNGLTPSGGQVVVTLTRLNTYNYLNGFIITEVGSGTLSSTSINSSTATTESSTSIALSVFPNPVEDRFLLQTNTTATGPMQVQLVDMTGAVKMEFNLNKSQAGSLQTYLSIGSLSPGQYVLKVQVGNWTETIKISKI
jgi:hypothetical protein